MSMNVDESLDQLSNRPRLTMTLGVVIAIISVAAMIPYLLLGEPERSVAVVSYHAGALGIAFLFCCGIALVRHGLRSTRGA